MVACMNAKSFVVVGGALVLCLFGGVLATGCVVEPEKEGTVLAKVMVAGATRPNLMLLVDTSGTMTDPMDKSDPDCTSGGVVCGSDRPCNTATCPTRWSTLQAAMLGFLDSSGTVARLGLTTYPSNESCGASVSTRVPLPLPRADDQDTLTANAQMVKNTLLSIKNYSTTGSMPMGGSPTSQSLQFLGSLSELQTTDREDIVLLVTDGLPNCNEEHPQPYPSAGCFCTLSDCSFAPEIGCLDKDASVAAVQSLRAKDIKTIVIGFGTDFNLTSSSGAQGVATLNAMAEQGGFARACSQNSDCGSGDTCDTASQRCTRRFYQAPNGGELASVLQRVAESVRKSPCLVPFAGAGELLPAAISVSLDGKELAPGESSWSLTDEGVLFTGAACQRLEAATPSAPVVVEVRAAH